MRKILLLVWIALAANAAVARAAPRAEPWAKWEANDPASRQTIDHGSWDRFLKQYLVTASPAGANRVRYASVTHEDRLALKNYLARLQSLPISTYNRAEQKAYWINLYNALMVDLVLSRYPIGSIRDLNISPGLLVQGPWSAKLSAVEGERLSLDDIEHRILRPIWKDSRVLYAVNWASMGSPSLRPEAYTRDRAETLLEQSAREFVNDARGVAIAGGKLRVSSLYVWFQEDFGGGAEGLMDHWQKYATGPLAASLAKYSGGLEHDFDWRLNGVEAQSGPRP